MAIPVRRRVPRNDRPAFSLRRTALGFVLAALLLCGAGLALRTAWQSALRHPAVAVATVTALAAVTAAFLRRRHNRRVAAKGAAAVVEAAYDMVDTGLAELDAAVREPEPRPRPEPVDYLDMDPYAFEEAIAGLCRRDGCTEVEVVGGAGDLGADVVATTPDRRRLVIQCKQYGPDNKVGSQDLQRFGGTCYAVHEAEVAVVVTTSTFTEPALEYAGQCGILCVDLESLSAWSEEGAPLPWHAAAAVRPSADA
ncbi:restriction endonuclease [Streptomyces sp. B1I3]|uniref:restriction endonuclease n=1 Tax=Streptomyces sp. B1I3 TaxID=3042264 RepID=UPI002787BA30|nr:restriction endonuclease [Streptomyces sp. B1I3]MDQ0792959.1 restriction system protein [Streptomyces sp. B1I3]